MAKKKENTNLEESLREIQKKFGEGAIMKLKDARPVDVDTIPTGSLALDMILGVGGIPRGRMIEIFGPESSGKTTLALHIVSEAQKQGGVGAFIDVENALDPDYAQRLGVNVNELLLSQPDSGEQALQIVETLVRSGEVDVIVVDSVAALAPRAEIAGEIGEFQIGLQARLMSAALRKLASIVFKTKTSLIFLNQTRMKIGQMFGNPETTSGGMALRFYTSVRIDLRRIAQIKSGENVIGSRVKAKIVKNKVAAPFRTAEFDIYYNEGISLSGDIMNLGLQHNLITKAGSWFQYKENKIGQGAEAARQFIKDNPKVAEEIRNEVLKNPR